MNLQFSCNIALISSFFTVISNISGQGYLSESDRSWQKTTVDGHRQQAITNAAVGDDWATVDGQALNQGGGKGINTDDSFNRYTTKKVTTTVSTRSMPVRQSFEHDCDNIAHYCLKGYVTGRICGRSLYWTYCTFENYCLLDYVNCREQYEAWQVAYMGACYDLGKITEYVEGIYYGNDYFLDANYIIE